MKLAGMWTLTQDAAQSWIDDYAPSMGAALAYYTLFSIAPLLLVVISVAGLVFGEQAAHGEIFDQLKQLMGAQGAQAIQGLLQSVHKPAEGIAATVIGVVAILAGATTVFGELQNSLDRIWRAPARVRSGGLLGLVRSRLLSFGMVLGIGFLLIVSLLTSAALSAFGRWWAPLFADWEVVAHLTNLALSFGLVTAVFAMIFKIMPRVAVQWKDVWVGAAVTSLLFTIGKFLIGFYIGTTSVASAFGAAGSLAVVLVWLYYSAQIFLMGAEFTWVYAHTYGSRRHLRRPGPVDHAPVDVRADAATSKPGAHSAVPLQPAADRNTVCR